MPGVARSDEQLLLGEWACLGIVCQGPTHGFAVAARLKPDGDVGRVWSLSRALTYRALEQLATRGLIAATGEEPGIAGGSRTILAITPTGRSRLRRWLRSPVVHRRDLRSELLLKLVLAEQCGIDVSAMLVEQRSVLTGQRDAVRADLAAAEQPDVVTLWRAESTEAALRFLDRVTR